MEFDFIRYTLYIVYRICKPVDVGDFEVVGTDSKSSHKRITVRGVTVSVNLFDGVGMRKFPDIEECAQGLVRFPILFRAIGQFAIFRIRGVVR